MENNEQEKKKHFIRNILWLKEAYGPNFEFEVMDANNNFTRKVDLWYRVLGHIESKTLEFVIFDFIKNSKWKPDSPAHILEHYKNMYEKLLPEAADEFEYAITLWRKNRNVDYTCDILLERGKVVSEKAFRSIRSQLHREATTDDINKWAKRDYIERYNVENVVYTNDVINSKPSAFLIEGNNSIKLLETS